MPSRVTLDQLLEAGSHFGHQSRRWNPAMKRFIYGEKDGVHVFDLIKSKECLDKAHDFLKQLAAEDKVILFLGTKRQAADMVKQAAVKLGMPYVTVRWLGGTLTNFDQMRKSVNRLVDLKDKREKGELKKYTKKEQLLIDREIGKLEKFFGGVINLTRLPDCLFVIDTHREDVAVREAVRMEVPVVGITDTNADPDLVDYPIPVNDDAAQSIGLVVNTIEDAIASAKTPSFAKASEGKQITNKAGKASKKRGKDASKD
jgi:small subunit ribosomal protein S2